MTFVTEPASLLNRKTALQQVYFLKTLPNEALEALAARGTERRLCQGEMLFAERGRCLGLVVVLSGAIKVYKLDTRGRELTRDLETHGDSVAEVALFDGGNYPASAEAISNGTTVLVVLRDDFMQVVAAHHEISDLALKALGVRIRKLMESVEAHALHSVRTRIASYLLDVAGNRTTFHLEETNDVIASRTGTVREVVSRTLRILVDGGAITLCGRIITISDAGILRKVAEGTEQ
jgi:CRP/FNR family transcriptional regulator